MAAALRDLEDLLKQAQDAYSGRLTRSKAGH
jgi:hypothetical protein